MAVSDYIVFRPISQWTEPRTADRLSSATFKASWDDTLVLLIDEVEAVGGTYPVVVQVDIDESALRRDGRLRTRYRIGPFPGVIVSFASRFGPLTYTTDAYEQRYAYALEGWQANVRAIALSLKALRAVDRYGVSRRGEQYAGWSQLPRARSNGSDLFPTADDAVNWMIAVSRELGDDSSMDPARRYRWLAQRVHPDRPKGNAELWERLDKAAARLGLGNHAQQRLCGGWSFSCPGWSSSPCLRRTRSGLAAIRTSRGSASWPLPGVALSGRRRRRSGTR